MTDSEFDQLVNRFLEGEQSEEFLQEFSAALKENPEKLADLQTQLAVDEYLSLTLDEMKQPDLFIKGLNAKIDSENFVNDMHQKLDAIDPPKKKIAFPVKLLALAATIAIIGLAGLFSPEQLPPNKSSSFVAILSNSDKAVWKKNIPVDIGAALKPGTLFLESGRAEVELDSGTRLALDGPAQIELLDHNHIKVINGKVSSDVPPKARGFVLETADGLRLVDLGTRFAVNASTRGQVDVHVFEGVVDVMMQNSHDLPGSTVRMNSTDTHSFNSPTGKNKKITFKEKLFIKAPEKIIDAPQVFGAVRLLSGTPSSLKLGHLVSDKHILLIREKRNITLKKPTPVTIQKPGVYQKFGNQKTALPAGTKVDSYIVHFDSKSIEWAHGAQPALPLKGSITFNRPIVGILANDRDLSNTDKTCGLKSIKYPKMNIKVRGMEGEAFEAKQHRDALTLSEDRKTVHLDFVVGNALDQIRILLIPSQP